VPTSRTSESAIVGKVKTMSQKGKLFRSKSLPFSGRTEQGNHLVLHALIPCQIDSWLVLTFNDIRLTPRTASWVEWQSKGSEQPAQ